MFCLSDWCQESLLKTVGDGANHRTGNIISVIYQHWYIQIYQRHDQQFLESRSYCLSVLRGLSKLRKITWLIVIVTWLENNTILSVQEFLCSFLYDVNAKLRYAIIVESFEYVKNYIVLITKNFISCKNHKDKEEFSSTF